MKRLAAISLLLSLLFSCTEIPQQEDPAILPGLPSMASVADSLNAAKSVSLKWSIQDDQRVAYAEPIAVDWKKEFQAFLKDDVNKVRYKDAYTISDETTDGVRKVVFDARTDKQEIRSVHYTFADGKLQHYQITKHRDNLLSSSWQRFTFNGNSYTLEVDQRIPKLFNNTQYIHGDILPNGKVWRVTFKLGDEHMPILMIEQEDRLLIKNGEELLSFHNEAGSTRFTSDYFNAYFDWDDLNDSVRTGRWVNAKYDQERIIEVRARADQHVRFFVDQTIDTTVVNLNGDHRMIFEDPSGNSNDTVLLSLRQDHHVVEGSVLTPTGDYRYLVGVVRNDSLLLSSMDGTHCYLFKARIEGKKLNGLFKAGKTWQQSWTADLGTSFQLPDAERLTTIRTDEKFNFQITDVDGTVWSLDAEPLKEKPVLVSIMGTWCSNCLDETRFLQEVKDRFGNSVEILALDFELVSDSAKAINNIARYKESLDIQYPIILAGLKTNKQKVQEVLPALSSMVSYPTLIVLDRAHEVVRIHTGFSGPATGDHYYEDFRTEYMQLIDSIAKK